MRVARPRMSGARRRLCWMNLRVLSVCGVCVCMSPACVLAMSPARVSAALAFWFYSEQDESGSSSASCTCANRGLRGQDARPGLDRDMDLMDLMG